MPAVAGAGPNDPHDKTWWRRRSSRIRDAIPQSMRQVRSRAAIERLLSDTCWLEADSVLTYAPIRSELIVSPLHAAAVESGKKLILSRVVRDHLELYEVADPDRDLVLSGRYQIPEPDPDRCLRVDDTAPIDLAVLPGLAFDARGGRIGYGRAYFDRLLSERRELHGTAPTLAAGIAFSAQITTQLPVDEWDVTMDAVFCESQTFRPRVSEGVTRTAEETRALGNALGGAITASMTVLFEGELGAGKTTCIQGLADALGVHENVVSPTFVYERQYTATRADLEGHPVHHLDLYRLDPGGNSLDADLAVILEGEGIVLLEWPDRLGLTGPPDAVWLSLSYLEEEARSWRLLTTTAEAEHLHEAAKALSHES